MKLTMVAVIAGLLMSWTIVVVTNYGQKGAEMPIVNQLDNSATY